MAEFANRKRSSEPGSTDRRKRNAAHARARALLALGSAGALVLVGLVGAPPALAATHWSTSFESGQPAPQTDTVVESTNLGSTYLPGSITQSISSATASSENTAGGEGIAQLRDGSAATKWLAFAQPSAGSPLTLTYTLNSGKVVKSYRMVSANDVPERDPKAWTLQGSNDGSSWTTLDTKTGQTFSSRGQVRDFSISNSTSYTRYRLSITENNGQTATQLAEWDLSDGSSTSVGGGLSLSAASGITGGTTIKSGAGWSGTRALKYAGTIASTARAAATSVLYQGVNVAVGSSTELSYMVMPNLRGADSNYPVTDDASKKYPATYVALDVEFSDGTRASSLATTDQYGYPATVAARDSARSCTPTSGITSRLA